MPACSDGTLRANGCNINTNTDNNNCGSCGHMCAMGSTCVAGTCVATNLVTNGDFETGDFTGWTLSDCGPGDSGGYGPGGAQHGSFFALTDCPFSGGQATLSQTISGLTVGQTYTMTAYYNGFANGTPDGVTFYVNGMAIASRLNQGNSNGWFPVTGSFTASTTSAVFSFSFGSDPNICGVDNIVIM